MRVRLAEQFVRDWASHICATDESRVMLREELMALVGAAYNDGYTNGREEMRAEIERLIEEISK